MNRKAPDTSGIIEAISSWQCAAVSSVLSSYGNELEKINGLQRHYMIERKGTAGTSVQAVMARKWFCFVRGGPRIQKYMAKSYEETRKMVIKQAAYRNEMSTQCNICVELKWPGLISATRSYGAMAEWRCVVKPRCSGYRSAIADNHE